MDGEITIGTTLSTDKFDRQVVELEKKMQKEENKKIVIETKMQTQQQQLDEAREKTDELANAYQRMKEITSSPVNFRAGYEEYGEIRSKFGDLGSIEKSFNSALTAQDRIEQSLLSTQMRYEELNSKVDEYKQKIESIQLQKQVAEVDRMKESFNRVGSSLQSSIKNVARLALGIFGVRSAYLALRRASSDLASYDKQYAANIEYIRYALTQMIAPVLQWIVRMAATLLGYLNAIMQAWFGINLFSRGSAANFNKMKAGASGVGKAVKEIKKQLTGFDEMNVLQDNGDVSAGGGGGGVTMPDFDLSAMQGEPPEWLQWIIDHKDEVLAVMAGIAAGLLAWKLGLSGIQALGIGIMIAGIVYAIEGLIGYLNDPSWENFGKIIQGIGVAIIGLGVIIGSVPVAVAGAIVLIVGTIIKYWDQIKAFLQKGIDWLTEKSEWVHEMFGDVIGGIYDTFVQNLQLILNWFDMTFNNLKKILDGIIQFVKGVFSGNWKQAWDGIKQIFGAVWGWIKNTVGTVLQIAWNMVVNFASTIGNAIGNVFKAIVNGVLGTVERVLNSPIRTINRLIGVINAVPRN